MATRCLKNQNTKVVAQHAASIGKSAQEQTPTAHLGWNSDYVNVHVDAVERHFEMKAGSPEKLWTLVMRR